VILRERVFTLLRMIREPLLLSFTTASSEAAYPKTLEQLERFGAKKRSSASCCRSLFVQPRRLDEVLHLRVLFMPRPQHPAHAAAAGHDAAHPHGRAKAWPGVRERRWS